MSVVDSAPLRAWIRRHYVWLLLGFVGGVASGVLAGSMMSPTYRTSVVLTPAGESAQAGVLGGIGSGLGGLAALAGVSLGAGGDRTQALEVLRSRQLARSFIEKNQLLPALFPPDRRSLFGKPGTQSLEDAVRLFSQRVIQIQEDRRTGVVVVSVSWHDPQLAAAWANDFVSLADETLRQRAVMDAKRGREYLERELARTQIVELRQAAAGLIENSLKSEMIASTRQDFAFGVADPAVAPDPDDTVRPKKKLLAVSGGIAGMVAAACLVWLFGAWSGRRPQASSG